MTGDRDGDGDDKGETKRVLTIERSFKPVEDSIAPEEIWFDGDDLAQASRIDWGPFSLDDENSPEPRVEIGSGSILGRSSILDRIDTCDLSSLPSNKTDSEFGFGWGLALSQIVGGLRPRQALWIQAPSHQPVASDWMAQLIEGVAAFRQDSQRASEAPDISPDITSPGASPSLLWVATKGYDAELWRCKYLARWTQTDWRMLFGGKTAANAFHLWTESEIEKALDRCRKWAMDRTNHIGRSLQVAECDSNSLRQLDEQITSWLRRHESSNTPAIVAFPESVVSLAQNNQESHLAFANLLLKIRQQNAISMIDSSSLISNKQSHIRVQQGDILLNLSEEQDSAISSEMESRSAPKDFTVEAQVYGQGELTTGICKFRWTPKFGRMLSLETQVLTITRSTTNRGGQ